MVSPACHREPVVELFVSHSKDPNYLTILEALQCDEHILRCWDILPPHGALVTVFFQDRDTCKGFVFQGEYRCAREMVWGMCRSLQFLEITTLDELAFPPPQLFTVCLSSSFHLWVFSPSPCSCVMSVLDNIHGVMFSSTPKRGIKGVRVTTENTLLTQC